MRSQRLGRFEVQDDVTAEIWKRIPGYSMYSISNYGRVKNNQRDRLMSTSLSNYGRVKVSLWSDTDGIRHTRSVALMVAQAFCKRPDARCDSPVILDGVLTNVMAQNIVWRPRWFAWRYFHQLTTSIHRYYQNLPVLNVIEDVEYESIVHCGMTEGLLFDDIWKSTYNGSYVYPHRCIYQILK